MLQKLINILYRNPRSNRQRNKRFGGNAAYRKMLTDAKHMEAAAWNLPPVQSYADGLPIYFLTGKKYAYQTLFCIASLSKRSQIKFNYTLVDDGTFDNILINNITKRLPCANLITAAEIEENLNKVLPVNAFPILRAKRLVYPHIKKLTDVHTLSGPSWKLVLDSDMLFWQEPAELIEWMQNPHRPLHMVDCIESYGYPTLLMETLCGNKLPTKLNVGAIGLNSQSINWQNVENWIKQLEKAAGGNYYLEQALSAMMVGEQPSTVLDEKRYQVNPTVINNGSVLQHYVDLSRKIYFGEGWKQV